MVILGLTGSIGMGKSNAARVFRRLGVPVHDADSVVHRLLDRGGQAVPAIAAAFSTCIVDGKVDRGRLGSRVFGDPPALARLEAILHPLVEDSTQHFLRRQARRRQPLVVLDIPLLYETGAERYCDAVVVVTAPAWLQSQRVLSRRGMSQERLAAILASQMPDSEKRRRADFVVATGLGKGRTLHRLREIVRLARRLPGRHWPPRIRPHRGGGKPRGATCHA